jgi:hypothetical protein
MNKISRVVNINKKFGQIGSLSARSLFTINPPIRKNSPANPQVTKIPIAKVSSFVFMGANEIMSPS